MIIMLLEYPKDPVRALQRAMEKILGLLLGVKKELMPNQNSKMMLKMQKTIGQK